MARHGTSLRQQFAQLGMRHDATVPHPTYYITVKLFVLRKLL